MGYDFNREMYYTNKKKTFKEGAIADVLNSVILNGSSNMMENFTHEVCHLYTHKLFGGGVSGRTYHEFINEGVSTFFGGAAGKSLSYLLGSLQSDIVKGNYKFDFANLLDNEVGVGEEDANLSYVTGGLICKLTYDKEGMNGIFKLLQGGWKDEDLYKTVENVLGVKRESMDSLIRNELKKYAR